MLRLMDHRHDEALIAERRTDADVCIRMELERVLVKCGVHGGVRHQCARASGYEVSREGEAGALALVFGRMPRAVRLHAREISLEQRGYVRRQRKTARHVLGHALAHGAVRNATAL